MKKENFYLLNMMEYFYFKFFILILKPSTSVTNNQKTSCIFVFEDIKYVTNFHLLFDFYFKCQFRNLHLD